MKFLDKNFGRAGNRMFQSFYLYAQMREGNIPDIFLQDCKYFDKYRSELMKMAFGGNLTDYDERVSIHVRRKGNPSNPDEPNYSENPFYINLAKTGYYEKAIKEFPDKDFLIFSDDIEWCKRFFGDMEFIIGFGKPKFYFSENQTEEEDFYDMAYCVGHIIANSSFSYMAAYLGGGKTVYPSEWFTDKIQRVGFPSEWLKL